MSYHYAKLPGKLGFSNYGPKGVWDPSKNVYLAFILFFIGMEIDWLLTECFTSPLLKYVNIKFYGDQMQVAEKVKIEKKDLTFPVTFPVTFPEQIRLIQCKKHKSYYESIKKIIQLTRNQ